MKDSKQRRYALDDDESLMKARHIGYQAFLEEEIEEQEVKRQACLDRAEVFERKAAFWRNRANQYERRIASLEKEVEAING